EGSLVWAENMVLLKDAPHPQQGYALIDYLLRPEVIARTSNYVGYPNGNQAALPLVERKLRENPAVYLSKETMATLFPLETLPLKVERIRTRVWSRVKTGS
ncbi:polyamine ABC transporter substrate-binding protein, partial [Pseudomonas sp. BIS1]|nr:polyamine ABC transporter substrate-binding protein [Pseudomonas sp. BIS1]